MNRSAYLIRRVLLVFPTFIGITLVCFALTRLLPGGPVEMRLLRMQGISENQLAGGDLRGLVSVTEAQRAALNQKFGFDKPFFSQYARWLFHDRMGLALESYDFPGRTAWQLLRGKMPVSLWFGITGFTLSYLVCVPLGIAKALRHGSAFDMGSSLVVFAGYAFPVFALGMLLKTLFCGAAEGFWDVFPLGGFESPDYAGMALGARVTDRLEHMFLPLACYVAGNFAVLTLMMKNSLLEQISADYVRTVLAKGASFRRAVWRHAFRNALIPVATGIGGILTIFFAGSVIIETIFEIPGMGRLSLSALTSRDYAVFMALLALTSSLQLIGNLFSDLCYMLIDPRIHFGK
ncbi:MAG: ABC transporter permease subunit [Kiritimatiellaeota bacterium]|nr:ABC transporter permease subunit [Kiritimatiellota bacterium]